MSRTNWTVPPGGSLVNKTPTPSEENMKERLKEHWAIMHKTAKWANKNGQTHVFPSWVKFMIDTLPCGACIPHGQAYYRMNSPERENCSLWMWKFHNSVNRRLGKPELDWESYDQMYLKENPAPCTACGSK